MLVELADMKLSIERRKKLSDAQKKAWANGHYSHRRYDNIRIACKKMGKKYGKMYGGKNRKREDRICPQCKSIFYSPKEKQLCCSTECSNKYHVGKNHWAYLHGKTSRTGNNWQKIRAEVIEYYDGKCQNCNRPDSAVVHHIMPRRFYSEINNSNYRVNLSLLCERCHRIIDYKLRWHRKEGEVRENLQRWFAMVTLSQVLAEMTRKVQRLMAEAKSVKICR